MPGFVVTHESRDPLPRQGGTTYHFVTGGLEAALADARAAAEDEDVGIRGVGHGLAGHPPSRCPTAAAGRARPARDDGRVRMVYGTRLFEDLGGRRIELKRTSTIDTPGATHLRFSVQT
jgi:hypothetical protein